MNMQKYNFSQVHELCSFGRYRESFDSFWNLGAILRLRDIRFRIICLTATLKPIHMNDVMRRISVGTMVVFRKSCYREGLSFTFNKSIYSEEGVVAEVSRLAVTLATDGKVFVFASSVKLCDMVDLQLQFLNQRQAANVLLYLQITSNNFAGTCRLSKVQGT